ncbi:2-dehydro-3-deoxy-D-gluconate 5-dehydrogenase KduD [Marinomonas mediterranea]|jgi:2-deoxy-D-gluconate 3-dehydrogenase|uniref:2-dehydro-3-deoxy-D-gluconate 5-dehydrogenase n=1 Tax=Marinomonas mediterranea (strain ATCC 700492 / JCM 21426 / NBRC 103028 / MMB-1) TaxID=717774 RepID=F2K0A9_MARM1|nr:2-dehydro-3-deoxy-D-gluconate 5-dehydrogenase KduD [Marinomonas mediterranea]ADZ89824.1 2-deoxy-D-gluconate 3-dehydrogenase [Marinomonas mediterranea MMB-1]WCN12008.1 2-dehydro-3-deoxy-D-gluconate 5-dehydrogenase KduD [Marinomonas mediterranea]WCN16045.1 2-dehydro-3-deoxy-D-gluconate 5-dehydrogenase KduD [Marinomonas mediterranea MMB-1]
MLNMFNLEGKVAIVTGCNTGLGQGMALALVKAGAKVVGVNRSNPDETAALIKEANGEFVNVMADVADSNTPNCVLSEAINQFGRVDILINNAGIIRRNDAIDFTEKDWDEVMDVNLKSVFFLSQAFAKQVIKQGSYGNIVNIASMLSYQGGIRVPSYTASKSGILGLTRLLANEWAKDGINVNAIAPGYMATNNTEALRNDESRSAEILGRIPAGRWGEADDVAGPVVFLSSDASRYVNGYTLAVDGGWLAR